MATQISGTTGCSQVQAGSINQDDLAANVVGNGPCFSVISSGSQVVPSNAATALTILTSELFDTGGNVIAGVFTAPVTGYYQLDASVTGNGSTGTNLVQTIINADGVLIEGSLIFSTTGYSSAISSASGLVYLTGGKSALVTGRVVGTGTCTITSARFSGFLARAA